MTVKVEVELPDPPMGYQWSVVPVVSKWMKSGAPTCSFDFVAAPIPLPKVVRYERTGEYRAPKIGEWVEETEPIKCTCVCHSSRWILRRIEGE